MSSLFFFSILALLFTRVFVHVLPFPLPITIKKREKENETVMPTTNEQGNGNERTEPDAQ